MAKELTAKDRELIEKAIKRELSYWAPATAAKVNLTSFRAGFIAGLGTSLSGLRMREKYNY